MKKIYRSMNGKEVDMNKLATQNETTVPVGNTKPTKIAQSAADSNKPAAAVNVNVARESKTVVSVPIQNTPARYAVDKNEQLTAKTTSKKQ